jgi:hypothetical protein
MRIEDASESDIALLNQTIEKFHQDLHAFKVTVKLIKVGSNLDKNGDPKGPALKLHGSPCAAQIRAHNSIQQYLTGYHYTIKVDMDLWDELSDEQKIAVLDHELTHAVIKRDSKGEVKRDDRNNLIVGCRPDDYTINGFFDVMQRHGQDAIEFTTLQKINAQVKDLYKDGKQLDASAKAA